MNEKKHIDRLFQEKFKNFEVAPDAAVWDNIHNVLHKEERKRRVIPLWWYSVGVAAMLVLLFGIGNVFNNDLNRPINNVVETEILEDTSNTNPKNPIVPKNHPANTESINQNNIVNTNSSEAISNAEENNINHKERTASQIANTKSRNKNAFDTKNDKIASQKTNGDNTIKEAVAENTPNLPQLDLNQDVKNQSNDSGKTILNTEIAKVIDQNTIKNDNLVDDYKEIISANQEGENIEDAIAKANEINEEEKENYPNRWNVSPNVAPVYFNTLGKGSSIDNQFVNNGKTGDINMSYGISGSYAINDKVKIRAGVNKVDLGYRTNDVMAIRDVSGFNVTANHSNLKNINFNAQGSNDHYMSSPSTKPESSAPQFVVSNAQGALEQQFGYIEVPLEVEYSILDSKFGLNVIGGFSTLFLNNNNVYSVLDNQRSLLGDANNINNTSYSANFGLGFNYNISNTLKLNLEPMFKYQINTFNNTSGDFRPYFIGVYSGFSFKF